MTLIKPIMKLALVVLPRKSKHLLNKKVVRMSLFNLKVAALKAL